MGNLNPLQILEQRYRTFSKGQKRIADYLLEHYDTASFMTAAKLAQITGVSEATVVRFAFAMGFDGYPDMQRSLQEMIRGNLTSVQRIRLTSNLSPEVIPKTVLKADMHNIQTTLDSINSQVFNEVIDCLVQAKRIYIVGIRSASLLAQFFSYYLNYILDNVITVTGVLGEVYEQMIRISDADVCVGISFPRYSTRTVEAMNFAKDSGAKIIAITDTKTSPLARRADHVLEARSDMASFADSLVAPLSLINALIVGVALRCGDETTKRLGRLENLWDMQRVYMTKQESRNKDK